MSQLAPPPVEPQVAPPPVAQVVVVQSRGNGFGVTGFVLGLIGTLAGLIPLLFFIAFPLGILGTIFGAIGWRRANRSPEVGGKGLAIAGVVLSVIAIALAIIGVAIIDSL
jgi:hypothetical protein